MHTYMTLRLFSIMTLFGILSSANAASFSLAISTDRPTATAHDDIVIAATFTNLSNGVMFPNFGPDPVAFAVEMYDGTGKAVPDSAYMRRIKSANTVLVSGSGPTILPGASRTVKVNVSELFDVPGPGAYSIQMTARDYGLGEARSNVILVTVLPAAAGSVSEPPPPAIVTTPEFPHSSGPAGKHYSLEISADRKEVFAGSGIPIPVYVRLNNTPPLDLALPPDIGFFTNADVRRADGKPVRPRITGPSGLVEREWASGGLTGGAQRPGQSSGQFSAGGQYGGGKDMAGFFDMSEPGTYFVQFWIKIPEQFGGGELRSNVLTFTVIPR